MSVSRAVGRDDGRASAVFRCRLACTSDVGLRRARNEDNFFFFQNVMKRDHRSSDGVLVADTTTDELIVVGLFDGLGGELEGEVASYAAASRLNEMRHSLLAPEPAYATDAFRQMQAAIVLVREQLKLSSIGTTANLLLLRGETALSGNVGDSPAFLMRNGTLHPIYKSDTDERLLKELGLDRKPQLTQFLGIDESDIPLEPHLFRFRLSSGDRILLCSDGLTDMVSHSTLVQEMRAIRDPADLAVSLLELALDAGGKDNITIIVCDIWGKVSEGYLGGIR